MRSRQHVALAVVTMLVVGCAGEPGTQPAGGAGAATAPAPTIEVRAASPGSEVYRPRGPASAYQGAPVPDAPSQIARALDRGGQRRGRALGG